LAHILCQSILKLLPKRKCDLRTFERIPKDKYTYIYRCAFIDLIDSSIVNRLCFVASAAILTLINWVSTGLRPNQSNYQWVKHTPHPLPPPPSWSNIEKLYRKGETWAAAADGTVGAVRAAKQFVVLPPPSTETNRYTSIWHHSAAKRGRGRLWAAQCGGMQNAMTQYHHIKGGENPIRNGTEGTEGGGS